jgi:hypothetical protein
VIDHDPTHDTSNTRKHPMTLTAEVRQWLAETASTTDSPEKAAAALALLDSSVPVRPPVAWVCACDEDNVRCPVHGWVARAGGAR